MGSHQKSLAPRLLVAGVTVAGAAIWWVAAVGSDDTRATVDLASVPVRSETYQPPVPKPVQLASFTPARAAAEPNESDTAASSQAPTEVERGSLVLIVDGLHEAHRELLEGRADPGLTARLSDAGALELVGLARGEELRFDDVPIVSDELSVTVEYGPLEERETLTFAVDALERSGETRRATDALDAQQSENAAIATLRSVAAAQQQLQASAAIDTDADGGGEHGYFAELAGVKSIREYAGGTPTINASKLDPPYLPTAFGAVKPGRTGGYIERQGYAFQIFLPGHGTDNVRGIAELPDGGASVDDLPDTSNCERMWCAYAWPLERGASPRRSFFVNQNGDVLETANGGPRAYVGGRGGPDFDAAFSRAGDMSSAPALSAAGLRAIDGRDWRPVGR